MVREVIAGLALMLSASASAQVDRTEWNDRPEVGAKVHLNEAFYVCTNDNPRDLMEVLMGIKDPTARRNYAGLHGCAFNLSNQKNAPDYTVEAVVADTCMDRQGQQCGREGHQLIVHRGVMRLTVISLSSDVDYD